MDLAWGKGPLKIKFSLQAFCFLNVSLGPSVWEPKLTHLLLFDSRDNIRDLITLQHLFFVGKQPRQLIRLFLISHLESPSCYNWYSVQLDEHNQHVSQKIQ